jgi:hypothetical protein
MLDLHVHADRSCHSGLQFTQSTPSQRSEPGQPAHFGRVRDIVPPSMQEGLDRIFTVAVNVYPGRCDRRGQ